jgi:hypothetical protein
LGGSQTRSVNNAVFVIYQLVLKFWIWSVKTLIGALVLRLIKNGEHFVNKTIVFTSFFENRLWGINDYEDERND